MLLTVHAVKQGGPWGAGCHSFIMYLELNEKECE